MEDAVEHNFVKMVLDENLDIDWKVEEGVLEPAAYVDHWRVVLYDHAFSYYFAASTNMKFAKGTKLRDFEDGPQIIHRVIYRYALCSLCFCSLLCATFSIYLNLFFFQ